MSVLYSTRYALYHCARVRWGRDMASLVTRLFCASPLWQWRRAGGDVVDGWAVQVVSGTVHYGYWAKRHIRGRRCLTGDDLWLFWELLAQEPHIEVLWLLSSWFRTWRAALREK